MDHRYHGKRWRRYAERYRADHPFCVGYPLGTHPANSTLTDVVDHIVPAWAAPERFFDPSNHQPLCSTCNNRKSLADAANYTPAPRFVETPWEPVIA